MGMFKADGTRRTKTSIATSAIVVSDPLVTLTEDIFETVKHGPADVAPDGSIKKLWRAAGTVLRQSEIDAKFPTATATAIAPATGLAAGSTVVTITGTDLDGTTGVTFGGTAATAVTVLSPTQVRCTTPAHAAGAVTVVITDDGGAVTKTGFYTYT